MVRQKARRDHLNRPKSCRRTILLYIIVIVFFNGAVFWLMYLFSQTDSLERVDFTPDYDIILTESKTFWRGVWFNRDRLFILRNEFMIEKYPLVGEAKTYHIPYGKVRNVTFEEGLDIFGIKIDGMNLYVKSRYRYDTIKSSIVFKSKKQFKTEEAKTILSVFSH
jgi:hypothetical protein